MTQEPFGALFAKNKTNEQSNNNSQYKSPSDKKVDGKVGTS